MALPLTVLKSAAGFYIGTEDDDGPVSRESEEYWPTKEAAEKALEGVEGHAWTQRNELRDLDMSYKLTHAAPNGRYIGTILEVRDGKAIQDAGRGNLVSHDVDKFSVPPVAGKKMDINYRDRIIAAAKDLSQDNHQVGVSINTR